MALFLVVHGKSLPKDIDPDQRFSDEGNAENLDRADDVMLVGHLPFMKGLMPQFKIRNR